MDTTYDILQALGLGLAFGLRPVLAPLVVAICAAANFAIDFTGTKFDFLEGAPGLIVLAVVAVAGLVEAFRQYGGKAALDGRLWLVVALVFGILFGSGSVNEHSDSWYVGGIVGAIAVLLGWAATSPLVTGARKRLESEAEASLILALGVELAAVVTSLLSIVFPPLAVVAALAVLVLLVRGRRTGGQTYAGLRTLSK
ncbi:MAG: hypothetical protein AAGC46_07425 [Solirubrobacteraceae bacterium]|nr:hypothetical protein [Patulibacter sp.]